MKVADVTIKSFCFGGFGGGVGFFLLVWESFYIIIKLGNIKGITNTITYLSFSVFMNRT